MSSKGIVVDIWIKPCYAPCRLPYSTVPRIHRVFGRLIQLGIWQTHLPRNVIRLLNLHTVVESSINPHRSAMNPGTTGWPSSTFWKLRRAAITKMKMETSITCKYKQCTLNKAQLQIVIDIMLLWKYHTFKEKPRFKHGKCLCSCIAHTTQIVQHEDTGYL